MPWYTASFVTHQLADGIDGSGFTSREYWCLLTAEDSAKAHVKAVSLAEAAVDRLATDKGSKWRFDGLSELLMTIDPEPSPSGELTWAEEELPPDTLDEYVKKKDQLSIFKPSAQPKEASGWYVCDLVLVEVHDTGSHGDSLLVWIDQYLISALDAESAYDSALALGREQITEPRSHRCDGNGAHWEFKGLRNVVQTIDPPIDGGMLYFEESTLSLEQLRALIPPRVELGVFRWEASHRPKSAGG